MIDESKGTELRLGRRSSFMLGHVLGSRAKTLIIDYHYLLAEQINGFTSAGLRATIVRNQDYSWPAIHESDIVLTYAETFLEHDFPACNFYSFLFFTNARGTRYDRTLRKLIERAQERRNAR